MAKPIPDGYHTITPYLCIRDAHKAIDFYTKAFGAVELFRLEDHTGKICHAEIKIGDSHIMIGDEYPQMDVLGPQARGGTTVSLMFYVEDVDASFTKALNAGAKVQRPVQDQFWGDRMGTLVDPYGHVWSLSTHKEDVSGEEIGRRFEQMTQQMQQVA